MVDGGWFHSAYGEPGDLREPMRTIEGAMLSASIERPTASRKQLLEIVMRYSTLSEEDWAQYRKWSRDTLGEEI